MQILSELRQRGVKDILICCVDDLKGFPEAIEAVFSATTVHTCNERQQRRGPVPGPGPRWNGVEDREIEQLAVRVLAGEMPFGLDCFAQLAIEGFNGICRVRSTSETTYPSNPKPANTVRRTPSPGALFEMPPTQEQQH
jgi:hypothetical protein